MAIRWPGTVHCSSPERFSDALRASYFRVSYAPPAGADIRAHAENFAAAVMRRRVVCTVVMDEIDQVSDRRTLPQVESLLRHGRNWGISFIGTGRRPAEVSRNITANLTDLWVFRFQEPRDLQYLKDFAGVQAAEACQRLPQYRYLRISMEGEPCFYEGGT